MKPAGEMIVDAARGDLLERERDHRERIRIVGAAEVAEQQLEIRWARELRALTKSTRLRIERAREAARTALDRLGPWQSRAVRLRTLEAGDQILRCRLEPIRIRRLERAELAHEAEQLRPGHVRGAEHGPALRIGEHVHRPAAAVLHREQRAHVDGIHIGPLLAIDLDADEVRVDVRGDLLALERLVLHDVAPVARRVAHTHEHELALAPRAIECLVAPRVPAHRVVRVLEQIRAGLEREAIRERMHGLAARCVRRREPRREDGIRERHTGQRRIPGRATPAAARGDHEQGAPPHRT